MYPLGRNAAIDPIPYRATGHAHYIFCKNPTATGNVRHVYELRKNPTAPGNVRHVYARLELEQSSTDIPLIICFLQNSDADCNEALMAVIVYK